MGSTHKCIQGSSCITTKPYGDSLEITQLTQAKHTPGPWVVRETSTHVTVVGANGDALFHDDKRIPLVLDDARLIAAAPELLEALNQAIAWIDGERTPINALAHARAAIAKATGANNDQRRPIRRIPRHQLRNLPSLSAMTCPTQLAILLLCMCSMCYAMLLDWQAMAVAILLPALMLGAADMDMRCNVRTPSRRPELEGAADNRNKAGVRP